VAWSASPVAPALAPRERGPSPDLVGVAKSAAATSAATRRTEEPGSQAREASCVPGKEASSRKTSGCWARQIETWRTTAAARRRRIQTLRITRQAFVPPKPNEFERPIATSACRATFGV